jgi:transcriptional regulator with XRE-family HTH domain
MHTGDNNNRFSEDEFLKALGLAIQDRRLLLNLSQERLAERAGLHRTYISDVERAYRNVSIRTLFRLAQALAISPSQLVEQAEDLHGNRS